MFSIMKYWIAELARTGKRPPIYALLSEETVQPPGHIACWSVSKADVLKHRETLQGRWQLAKIEAE